MVETRPQNFNLVLVGFVFISSLALLLRRLFYLAQQGGDSFQQADWLINFSSGLVRRGFSGELFLALSHVTGIGLVELVCVAQALILSLIIFGLYYRGRQLKMPDCVVILLLCPFLLLLWVNDTNTAFRKEMLGMLSFIPLITISQGVLKFYFSSLLFILAVLFHEGNIFFAPALIYSVYLLRSELYARVQIIIIIVAGILGGGFALVFVSLPDVELMCLRVLNAGGGAHLCEGIFPWLAAGFSRAQSDVTVMLGFSNIPLVVITILLLLGPIAWVASVVLTSRFEMLAILIVFFSFSPLFWLATDWSRWLSMQVFSISVILLIKFAGRGDFVEKLPRIPYFLVILLYLTVGVAPSIPEPTLGFVFEFFSALFAFLT